MLHGPNYGNLNIVSICKLLFFYAVCPQYLLLNAVCCSLVHKSATPGQKDWDSQESVWTKITSLVKDIAVFDPQFVLKVRREQNTAE